jgi:predicted permease
METLMTWIGVAIAVINIGVCVVVIRSGDSDPIQKKLQMLVVWLFPLIWSVLVGLVLWSIHRREASASKSTGDHSKWENLPQSSSNEHHAD